MNILLIGSNGAMGQAVLQLVNRSKTDQVVLALQSEEETNPNLPIFNDFEALDAYVSKEHPVIDVVIDFSSATLSESVVNFSNKYHLPLVLATTGQSADVEQLIFDTAKTIPIINTHNTSIGVNVMQKALQLLTEYLYPLDYDIEIIEKHHRFKKDAPSGTAKMLFDSIQSQVNEPLHIQAGREGFYAARPHNEVGMHAIRSGNIVGEHTVIFANNNEEIEITHRANNRSLFAQGALKAAAYLTQAEPGLYDMSDVLDL
ncbi:4-hydroxy-tetrahydrodipicolinate reductase [Fundicoccus culcitae]|uniref:4-hydroxy-tetrahydrodipicolinate reductase n=1 Tax=Fundicoccus culcitae TaxID=2969821 RepID=A0ABY5P6K6_9LACT|nr:4-hydroxy-tetrahydrodipicolinate reductase [Fundicoccus culcitae]UUX34053.1 4-hydroxy-tetrahydrodipicolinate reductase [Fundicoccus culcitae]